jgi:hypothetical protein
MEHVDQVFDRVHVTLDEHSYHNCTFKNCVIHFSGGPVEIVNCRMDVCGWQLEGPLAGGLSTIRQLMGTDGLVDMIRGIFGPLDEQVVSRL